MSIPTEPASSTVEFTTDTTVYELDLTNYRIRRREAAVDAGGPATSDAEPWLDFITVSDVRVGRRVAITWRFVTAAPGEFERLQTITRPVLHITRHSAAPPIRGGAEYESPLLGRPRSGGVQDV